ncbi:MAG: hypothetical protein J1F35_04450 [Erysipelotrichales bacterium]|nr:hypothetical protein [Erysipelotrichales bacterium]
MEINDFKNEILRVFWLLDKEISFYKHSFVYCLSMLDFQELCDDEMVEYITEYFNDLIDDAELEQSIIGLMNKISKEKVDSMTSFFFEDTDEYKLFVNLLKKINNSSVKRFNDVYPEIIKMFDVVTKPSLYKNNYKGLKRKKYISEDEYNAYLQALKK